MNVVGGLVVAGSDHQGGSDPVRRKPRHTVVWRLRADQGGSDPPYLADALARCGPGFVGVTQVPGAVTDEEVLELHGVRAVRFNLHCRGALDERVAVTR